MVKALRFEKKSKIKRAVDWQTLTLPRLLGSNINGKMSTFQTEVYKDKVKLHYIIWIERKYIKTEKRLSKKHISITPSCI